MTKEEFLKIVEECSFDEAMEQLGEEVYRITTMDMLEDFVRHNVGKDNNLALHVLEAIRNSEGMSEWFAYDYSSGTCDTPVCLNTVEDVDNLDIFEKE